MKLCWLFYRCWSLIQWQPQGFSCSPIQFTLTDFCFFLCFQNTLDTILSHPVIFLPDKRRLSNTCFTLQNLRA